MGDETHHSEDAAPAPIVNNERVLPVQPVSEPALIEADPSLTSQSDTVPLVPENKVEADEAKPAVPSKDVAPTSALQKLYQQLPTIFGEAEYREMWGVELSEDPDHHVPTQIVVTKFLRANTNDVLEAQKQLVEALKWRKKMEPLKLLKETEFNKAKFGNLGFMTTYQGAKGKEVVTWNIYGGVKDKQATFGDIEEFLRWRTALMELSIAELSLSTATEPIPESGPDPYRMIQVHDYLNVSFLRVDPAVKAASKQTIQVFSMAYPELLKEKFFVNVPVIMSWMFAAMKLFLSPETAKKFHPLGYGEKLAGELPEFGEQLPKAYGGKGKDVTEGLTVRYGDVVEEKKGEK